MQVSSTISRNAAYTILMANIRETNVFGLLPKDIVYEIAKQNIEPRVNIVNNETSRDNSDSDSEMEFDETSRDNSDSEMEFDDLQWDRFLRGLRADKHILESLGLEM